jgi:hypothetical protein
MPRVALFALLILQGIHAQSSPDCSFSFTFQGNATQNGQDNRFTSHPCVAWRVTYTTSGTLTATVAFQTSPDNIIFTAVPNAICSGGQQPPCLADGANPTASGRTGSMAVRAYDAWTRIVTAGAAGVGTGTVVVYGYKGTSASALTSPFPGTITGNNVSIRGTLTVGTRVLNGCPAADATGAADSTTALQACFNSFGSGFGTILLGQGSYKISGAGLSVPFDHVSLIADRSTIDATAMTTGVAMTLTATAPADNPTDISQNNGSVTGLRVVGPGKTSAVTAFKILAGGSSTAYLISLQGVTTTDFLTCFDVGANAFWINLDRVLGWNCGTAILNSDVTNTMAGIRVRDSVFTRAGTVITCNNPNGDVTFEGTAFEQSDVFIAGGGCSIWANGSRFENALDTDYWFKVSAGQVRITNATIMTGGVVRTKEIGNSTVSDNGGLHLTGITWAPNPAGYTPLNLIAGTGRSSCSQINSYVTNQAATPTCSAYTNRLGDPGFELQATPTDWVVNGAFTTLITVASDQFHTGAKSLKITATGTGTFIYATLTIPYIPGNPAALTAWIKTQGLTGADFAYVDAQFLDIGGHVLLETQKNVTTVVGWQKIYLAWPALPGGVANVKYLLAIGNTTPTTVAWFDDVTISH